MENNDILQPANCCINFTISKNSVKGGVYDFLENEVKQVKEHILKDIETYKMLSISDVTAYLCTLLKFGVKNNEENCDKILHYEDIYGYTIYNTGWTRNPFKRFYIQYKKLDNGDYKTKIRIIFNETKVLE
jgi:hypothetical protein